MANTSDGRLIATDLPMPGSNWRTNWALADSSGSTRSYTFYEYDEYGNLLEENGTGIGTITYPNEIPSQFDATGEKGLIRYQGATYYGREIGSFDGRWTHPLTGGRSLSVTTSLTSDRYAKRDAAKEGVLHGLDQFERFVAGFANTVSFGATDTLRTRWHGDWATRNQQGTAYMLGMGAGIVASLAMGNVAAAGMGAARAGTAAARGFWAVRVAQAYTTLGTVVGVAQSSVSIYNTGKVGIFDALAFLPAAGWAAGTASRMAKAARLGRVAPSRGAWGLSDALERGKALELRLGKNTPDGFAYIDDWNSATGAAVSIKTTDITRSLASVEQDLRKWVRGIAEFPLKVQHKGYIQSAGLRVDLSAIRSRALRVGIEPGKASSEMRQVFERIRAYGKSMKLSDVEFVEIS